MVPSALAYERMEKILDGISTYLLRGQYKKNGIMTIFNIRQARIMELAASTLNGNAEDLIYSSDGKGSSVDSMSINSSAQLSKYSHENTDVDGSQEAGKRKKKRLEKIHKRYTQSNTYKLSKLYSTLEVGTDDYYHDGYNYNGKRIKCNGSYPYKHKEIKDEYGNKYIDTKEIKIGGRKGALLYLNQPYESKWSNVDTENVFEFDNCKWTIDGSLEQYQVKNRYDETEKWTNESEMEKVLCYKIDNKYHFYDEKIQDITQYVNKL